MSVTTSQTTTFRALRLLNLYRVIAAGVLFVLVIDGAPRPILGALVPELFLWIAGGYLAFAVLSSFTIHFGRPSATVQLYTQVVVDITAIVLLTYASGGARSGLGGLLFVPVAAGSLLAPQRPAIFFAALATLALLGAEVYAQLAGLIPLGGYTQAGILGLILFTTAVLGFILARRARESEALAEQRGVDLANLPQLNEYVIQHLQTGVIAVDEHERIRMMNASAAAFLGAPPDARHLRLHEISHALAQCLRDWRTRPWDELPTLPGAEPGTVLTPHLTPLGRGADGGALIFLEDTRVVAERMQAMKLAALGRLTASIAHEVRNPLGAISHAGQLLAEAEHLGPDELRLTEIIRTQTERMNTIIENVLQLSRRQQTRPERLSLNRWLDDFADEFAQMNDLPRDRLLVRVEEDDLVVRMDPTHLQQVVWNLCENALRHSPAVRGAIVELRGGRTGAGAPCLDVMDHGPGIDASIVQHIFEPFYSARAQGTGLGLFIARELSECNQARLSYQPRPGGGSCFRISFADASRWVV
ncbi:MAG: PAS domain-containing sensor histidine kinase [Gammaproteobacteria bacterium]